MHIGTGINEKRGLSYQVMPEDRQRPSALPHLLKHKHTPLPSAWASERHRGTVPRRPMYIQSPQLNDQARHIYTPT